MLYSYLGFANFMAKKSKSTKRPRVALLVILAIALLIFILIAGWAAYRAEPNEKVSMPQTKSKFAYVDGNNAATQVENFYKQYTNLGNIQRIPGYRQGLITSFGSENLVFYSKYYQHGFDPINCSDVMPTTVTTSLISTGPVANINAFAVYPDKTKATIKARVVLNENGLKIDSIACPDDKGNLLPTPLP